MKVDRCEWSWTFGIYWGPIGRKQVFGIDLGPFEVVWSRPR